MLAVFGSTDTTPDQSFLFRRAVQPAAPSRHTATRKRSEENINHLYRACCCFCRAASLLSLWLSAVRKTFTLPAWLRMRTERRSVSRSVRRRVPCDTEDRSHSPYPPWPGNFWLTLDEIKMYSGKKRCDDPTQSPFNPNLFFFKWLGVPSHFLLILLLCFNCLLLLD